MNTATEASQAVNTEATWSPVVNTATEASQAVSMVEARTPAANAAGTRIAGTATRPRPQRPQGRLSTFR